MGDLYNPFPKLPKNIRQIGERDQTVRLYLEDYVNLELEIAKEFHVDILDNYHESGIGGSFEDWEKYTTDGLHLNEDSRRLIAERIAQVLRLSDGE